jgi:hypothetical protein
MTRMQQPSTTHDHGGNSNLGRMPFRIPATNNPYGHSPAPFTHLAAARRDHRPPCVNIPILSTLPSVQRLIMTRLYVQVCQHYCLQPLQSAVFPNQVSLVHNNLAHLALIPQRFALSLSL